MYDNLVLAIFLADKRADEIIIYKYIVMDIIPIRLRSLASAKVSIIVVVLKLTMILH